MWGRVVLAALVGAALGAPTQAQDAGWVAGATLGSSSFKGYELEQFADNVDDSDTGFGLFGGYQFSPYFMLLGGLTDLGALNADSGSDYVPPEGDRQQPAPYRAARRPHRAEFEPVGPFDDTIEAKGFHVTAVGIAPIAPRVALLGSVGLFAWDQDVDYSDLSGDFSESASGTSALYGAGVGVKLGAANQWAMHLMWTRHSSVGDLDKTGHENDIDLLSVGATYSFGKP
jgi:OOP family OmpA-OmpF porin